MSEPQRDLRLPMNRRRLLEGQERLRVKERERLLQRLRLQPDDRVFDIGCSSGILLRRLEQAGVALAVGCDADPEIPSAVNILPLHAQDLRGVETGSFTKVVMSHILEHMAKPDRILALREAARILQANGELHINIFLYTEESVRSPAVLRVSDHNEIITQTELIAELVEAGFSTQPADIEEMNKLSDLVTPDISSRSLLVGAIKVPTPGTKQSAYSQVTENMV